MIRTGALAPLTAACSLVALASARPEALQPFTATYGVEWRGMGAGTSTLELARSGEDTWTYRSRNTARGIFRLAFPQAITQASLFTIRDGEVVPLAYRADDGSRSTARDVALEFDWSEDRVTGVAEDAPVNAKIEEGTQDALSVQIALMRALEAGRTPERFLLFDKDELKQYVYTPEGTARVATPLGEFDTIVYRSEREGSSRVTRLWLATSLGYLPVRAQQLRRGRVEFTMTLRSLERSAQMAEGSGG